MKQGKVKKYGPFIIASILVLVMAQQNITKVMGSRIEVFQNNKELNVSFIVADGLGLLAAITMSVLFWVAWKRAEKKNIWQADILALATGVCVTKAVNDAMGIVSSFFLFPWLILLVRFCLNMYWVTVANYILRDRKIMLDIVTTEEQQERNEKLGDIIARLDDLKKLEEKRIERMEEIKELEEARLKKMKEDQDERGL